MKKRLLKNISIICAICLVLGLAGSFANAQNAAAEAYTFQPEELVPVYLNGIKMEDGYLVEGTTYIPVRAFFTAEGSRTDISWNAETLTASVSEEGLEFSVTAGASYFTANDRSFYLSLGALLIEGSLCLPARELARIYEGEVLWNEEISSVDILMDRRSILKAGEDHYVADDLYWLARIISAESGNQSMEGKIAVGNVVLNRLDDPTCPDTIYDVIFDNKYGVQFSVTQNGTIYNEPNEESLIAAKICLEGYNLVENAIYFVNPEIGVVSWFAQTRVFIDRIGEHDFYA